MLHTTQSQNFSRSQYWYVPECKIRCSICIATVANDSWFWMVVCVKCIAFTFSVIITMLMARSYNTSLQIIDLHEQHELHIYMVLAEQTWYKPKRCIVNWGNLGTGVIWAIGHVMYYGDHLLKLSQRVVWPNELAQACYAFNKLNTILVILYFDSSTEWW